MSEISLREFAEAKLKTAQSLVRKGKELIPVFVIESPIENVIIPLVKYTENRQAHQRAMKKTLQELAADRYAVVMEAWFGTPPDTRPGHHDGYLPSKDPKRMECICVSAASSTGEKLFLIVEIKRGKQGLVQFKEFAPDGGHALGALMDLFGGDTKQ